MSIKSFNEKRAGRQPASLPGAALLSVLVVAALAAGCEVVNPGPVGDEFIDLPASQAGLVNGSWERMNRIIGTYSYNDAFPARELFHGGQTGSYGHGVSRQAGNMGGWGDSGPYNNFQQARWIAEEAIRRFDARGDVSADIMTQASLAAGYANRIGGDFYCHGVIDSGPLLPGEAYWERAEGHFTNALASAATNEQRHAAYAGRAQARLALEDWAGALADAQQVPNDFEIFVVMDFSKGGNTGQRNHVYWANADSPFRSYTVTHTFFDGYYTESGDPRVPWAPFPSPEAQQCVGSLQGYPGGRVPCVQQRKYTSQDDDIMIASGAEMRLVEAEATLRMNPGNWQAAMALINANRARYVSDNGTGPLTPWVAETLDDAWTFLMRERGIELWMEARRFADMRRWERYIRQYGTFDEDGQTVLELPQTTPGQLDWPCFECVMQTPESNIFTNNSRGRTAINGQSRPRELCYNISGTERNNNPNLLEQDDDIAP